MGIVPGTDCQLTLDHEDISQNAWVVHVYEDLPDHTATFNWYYVNNTQAKSLKNLIIISLFIPPVAIP